MKPTYIVMPKDQTSELFVGALGTPSSGKSMSSGAIHLIDPEKLITISPDLCAAVTTQDMIESQIRGEPDPSTSMLAYKDSSTVIYSAS